MVYVGAFGIVAEATEAVDAHGRYAPRDRVRTGEIGQAYFRNHVLLESQLAARAVEEVIGAETELVHLGGREHAGVRNHRLPHVR